MLQKPLIASLALSLIGCVQLHAEFDQPGICQSNDVEMLAVGEYLRPRDVPPDVFDLLRTSVVMLPEGLIPRDKYIVTETATVTLDTSFPSNVPLADKATITIKLFMLNITSETDMSFVKHASATMASIQLADYDASSVSAVNDVRASVTDDDLSQVLGGMQDVNMMFNVDAARAPIAGWRLRVETCFIMQGDVKVGP